MKRVITLLLFLSLILCGCYVDSRKVLFQQPTENIVLVEFVDHRMDAVLTRVSGEAEIDALIHALSSVPCKRHFSDPPGEYGDHLIRLYYSDGSIEIIGSWAFGYISPEQKENMNMWYYLQIDTFESLFSEYTNAEFN